MKLQFGSMVVALTLLSTPLAWSQAGTSGDSSSAQAGAAGSSQPQSAGPQPVFTHPEDKPPLALLDEVTAQSFIQLGMQVGAYHDSNASAFGVSSYRQTLFTFGPLVQVQQTRPTMAWSVGYSGGLTINPDRPQYNTFNHDATGNILWQINKHWQINAQDTYVYTADPFQQYLVFQGTPTYNQPNPTIYSALATLETNYGTVDVTNQITPHDSITFTGAENFRRYLYDVASQYNTYSWAGLGAYQHQFSAKLVSGAAYSFTALDFAHGLSRSGINMIQFFTSYQFNPHMVVSGWLGPEVTNTKSIVPVFCLPNGCFIEVLHQNSFNLAFGGNFGWNGMRNSFNASFAKQTSDGGSLLGVVRLYMTSGNYIRQLTPRLNFVLGMLYGNNLSQSVLYHNRSINTFTANAGFTRQFTPAWSATLQYLRFYETQKNIYLVPVWTDNRFQLTLQYNWGHSLGR